MPKGIERTQEELRLRRDEIAEVAADLFCAKGYRETSVSQIAKAAGMGKSSLYDYFVNKDEIVVYLMGQFLKEITQQAKYIIAGEGSVTSRIRRIMQAHLEILLRDKAEILKLSQEAQHLSREYQLSYQTLRYTYQDLVSGLVQEGIDNQSFKEMDPAIVTKTIFAVMSSLIFTSRPTGTPQEMLEQSLDLIFKGLEK
ncbi:MAG: TetR/AcrR family transcriptional regulator [Anaerolineaceae bacterium]|nr:TetR/AcrR family transcriptional regulator [Anaerolineaceae bacterium]